jgi:hypothetical protein
MNIKKLGVDNWPVLLRTTLLFQGRVTKSDQTLKKWEDLGDDEIAQKTEHFKEICSSRTARIISSTSISAILAGADGAIFVGLRFGDKSSTHPASLICICSAIAVLIWSLISGLQYFFLFFEDPDDRVSQLSVSSRIEAAFLYERAINLTAKATVISICQSISGLLTLATFVSLVF